MDEKERLRRELAESVLSQVRVALLKAIRGGQTIGFSCAIGMRTEGPVWCQVRLPDGSAEIVVRIGPRGERGGQT